MDISEKVVHPDWVHKRTWSNKSESESKRGWVVEKLAWDFALLKMKSKVNLSSVCHHDHKNDRPGEDGML